jgi:hypothetical protein
MPVSHSGIVSCGSNSSAKLSAISRCDEMRLALYEYVLSVKENEEKPPEPKVAYKIPIGITKKAMKLTFTRNMSQTAMGHLHVIEDLCSLFKLAGIHHDDVKKKLQYLFISGDSRIWFRSLNENVILIGNV